MSDPLLLDKLHHGEAAIIRPQLDYCPLCCTRSARLSPVALLVNCDCPNSSLILIPSEVIRWRGKRFAVVRKEVWEHNRLVKRN